MATGDLVKRTHTIEMRTQIKSYRAYYRFAISLLLLVLPVRPQIGVPTPEAPKKQSLHATQC
jgi:hypothetical protein